jgi:hypothetical protein
LDPVSTPLSNYALTGAARWFDAALLLLLVAELVLSGALLFAGLLQIGSFAFVVLGLCAMGLGAMVVFPDHTTATGQLTVTGWLHLGASVLAFGGPPLACLALARRHPQAAGCSRLPGLLGWLGAFALGWFAVLATVTTLGWILGSTSRSTSGWYGQWVGGAGTSAPAWQYYPYDYHTINGADVGSNYGLIERGLTAAELLIALVLIAWAWRGCRCRTSALPTDQGGADEP